MSKSISIYLSDEEINALAEMAKQKDCSKSKVIKQLIKSQIKKGK